MSGSAPGSPERSSEGGRALLLVVLVVVVSTSAFLPILDAYFRTDDFGYLHYYWRQPGQSLPAYLLGGLLEHQDIWGEPTYALRPVIALAFRLNTLISGSSPIGYHLFGIVLHGSVTFLVMVIARKLLAVSRFQATFAALLFGVLPVHAEPVAWISSVGDVAVAFFTLLAFLAFGLARQAVGARAVALSGAACLAFACALFTKESALTFMVLFPLWHLVQRERRAEAGSAVLCGVLRRCLPLASVFAVYVVIRFFLLPEAIPEEASSPAERLAVFATRQPFYLGALIHPELGLQLLPGHSLLDPLPPGSVGGTITWIGAALLTSFVCLGALSLWTRRIGLRARQALLFGPAWYVITTLPLALSYATDRHLYLPSVGPCLALACLPWLDTGRVGARRRIVTVALAGVVLATGWVGLLRRECSEAERGDASHATRDGLIAAANGIQRGSRLIVLPEVRHEGRWLWRWSLPFALRPPFATHDLYERFEIIESPDAYCCPPPVWWRDRRQRIRSWLADGATPTFVLSWSTRQRRVVARPVAPVEVRNRLRKIRADGGSPQLESAPIVAAEAILLVEGLRH